MNGCGTSEADTWHNIWYIVCKLQCQYDMHKYMILIHICVHSDSVSLEHWEQLNIQKNYKQS